MDFEENLQKCREYIKALEDEKRKIEMFSRELPLCLNLVTQAIEAYKHQLSGPSNTTTTTTTTTEHCLNRSHSDCSEQTTSDDGGGCPVVSEFIPIKRRQPSTSTTAASEDEDDDDEEEEESCDHHHHESTRSLNIDINSDINDECKVMMNCDLNDKVCSTSSCSSPAGGEKVDWLRSVQLWNQSSSSDPPTTTTTTSTYNEENQISHRPRKVQVVEVKNGKKNVNVGAGAGAFHQFHKEPNSKSHDSTVPVSNMVVETAAAAAADMAMTTSVSGSGTNSGNSSSCKKDQDHGSCNKDKDGNGQSRKARRCWSADLHKKFLNALQQLGGSHVATPKQIRELMKVDGLTNDEVKSHLQKYRLNCRRPAASIHNAAGTSQQPPQFVVVGGIWVPSPPEYASPHPQSGVPEPAVATLQHATTTTSEMRVNRNKHNSESSNNNNSTSSSNGRCSGSGGTSSSFSGLLVSN